MHMRKTLTAIAIQLQAIILVCEVWSHNYLLAGIASAVLVWLLWLLFAKEEVKAGMTDQMAVVPDSKPIECSKSSDESEPTDEKTQLEASSAQPKGEPDENRAGEVSKSSLDGNAIQHESSVAKPSEDSVKSDDDFSSALAELKEVIGENNYIAANKIKKKVNKRNCSDILASSENAVAMGLAGFGFWKEKRTQLTLKGSAFFRLEWAADAEKFLDKITKLAVDDIRDYLLKPENRRAEPFRGQDLWRAATDGKYNGILDPGGKHIIPLRTEMDANTTPWDRALIKNLERLGIGCGAGKKIYLLLEEEEACRYLQENFGKDLKTWFAMSRSEELGCDVVRSVYNSNRPQNNLIDNERRTCIFAAAFQAMIEQTLRLLTEKGEREATEYCKQHGWPLCNIRQYDGTLLSAEEIAKRAELTPDAKYSPMGMYKSLYKNAVPLFRNVLASSEIFNLRKLTTIQE